ncbi:Bifunctional DNA primase/polymerase, N-terminal [Neorhodopirellula lusitana]|uniref:Bifunctional DNA primase/polymerase, N-terminal n=1 Tax=Neorhodopirellula lusitana TaxID=445327 RepID=A0ABY1PPR7_9BACT|nr:bifunctional DNA primase/polymerase [Neorhodopirellula lusitana]SMP41625.1 Bifunctional DNA primase/polymerase, N-terminal [Neorhodopirellula lusitana]
MNALLDHALRYHAMGWSIIPVKIGTKEKPISWKRYQTERATESTVRRWCRKDVNIAVVSGPVSGGLVVRDFDEAGAHERWAADHGELAASLPTVQTARGHHVYARLDEPVRVVHCGDGELRGCGGYTMLPPSVHPSGQVYRWLREPSGVLPTVAIENLCPPVLKEAKDFKEAKDIKDSNGVRDTSFKNFVERFSIDGPGQGRNALKQLALAWLAANKKRKPPAKDRVIVHSLWWDRFGHHRRTDNESSFEDFDRMLDELRGDSFLLRVRAELPNSTIPDWAIDEPEHRQQVAVVLLACHRASEGEPFPLAATIAAQLAGLPDPKIAHRALQAFCRKEHVPLQLFQRGERRPGGQPNIYHLSHPQ